MVGKVRKILKLRDYIAGIAGFSYNEGTIRINEFATCWEIPHLDRADTIITGEEIEVLADKQIQDLLHFAITERPPGELTWKYRMTCVIMDANKGRRSQRQVDLEHACLAIYNRITGAQ